MRDQEQAIQASATDPKLAQPQRQAESLTKEQQVLQRIERVRRRKARLREERITMAHGAGGKATLTLIEALFLEAFRNPLLAPLEDQAVFNVDGVRLAFTTDSFVVSPLFFPGGNIGDLAVNGTVNDLVVSGARPLYLSRGLSLRRGSRWQICSGLCSLWLPPRLPLAWPSPPATPKLCNAGRLTAVSSTLLVWVCLSAP